MEAATFIGVLGLSVLVLVTIANRLNIAAPLLLTVVGAVGSYLPFLPEVPITPDLVLIGLLPPLLYAAASSASLIDFRAEKRSILALSVGLVAFTAVCVGLVAWWLLPVPLSAALALGAIVAPPDAVAASAVARRIGLPRRVVTILEGESLLNDATAIVLLRMSVAAIVGSVTFGEIALSFAISVVGGVAIGWLVAAAAGWAYRHISDAPITTGMSLLIPFAAYLPAEEIHASGVVAVVVAGLLLAHRAPVDQTPTERMGHTLTWRSLQMILENTVFLLIGLQTRTIVTAVANSPLGWQTITVAVVGVLLTVMIARPLWIFGYRLIIPRKASKNPLPVRDAIVASYAGMRGVVTLVAAFVLPEETPHRNVLVFAAMVVTAGTLLLQGSTLPRLARRLGVRGPMAREDALQEARVLQESTQAGIERLDKALADGELELPADIADGFRLQSLRRSYRAWEQLGATETTPSEQLRVARLLMIDAERESVIRLRDEGAADHEVLQRAMRALDVEQTVLAYTSARDQAVRHETLHAPTVITKDCAHLQALEDNECPPPSGETCLACAEEGTDPVHLRICLICGNVGCCDSSVGTHATRHFQQTGHPVMRSFEPGEKWRWCYVDEIVG